MKRTLSSVALVGLLAPVAWAQQITPVWVQHINGLVNTDPADALSVIKKNLGAPYAGNGVSRSQQFALGKLKRYDANRFLLMVKENGIDEAGSMTPEQAAIAAAYPDRSLTWIDAATGKPLGLAHNFGVRPITATGQGNNNDFWSNWDIDEGPDGQRVLYSTHKNVILRWAPKAGGGWETTPTCAWTEPTPGASDCAGNPLDGTSGGDGNASWRWRDFRVTGTGASTMFVAGGGTWRASLHVQIFKTDDGLKFHPIARFNDRDGGHKNNYSQGGLTSHLLQYGLDAAHPNLATAYHGRYPGTGWQARPSRFLFDMDVAGEEPDTYNPDGYVKMFQVDHSAWGNLPAFAWESAGANGLPINHAVDGVEYYDGNWGGILDAKADVDYVVNFAFPSWNNQFGSIKKPGWLGVHRLDGAIASNSGYKLPFTEMDIQSNDAGAQVGNEFGYDGNVELYPNAAGAGKALLMWVGSGYGYGLFTVQNVAASIVAQPQDASTTENQDVKLTAEVAGSPNTYQWLKDGVPVDGTKTNEDGSLRFPRSVVQGVNKAILSIPKAQLTDSGRYQLRISNPVSGVTLSREAVVSIVADTVAPTITASDIARSADATYIKLTFSEAVTPETASNPGNYRMSGGVAVNGAKAISTTSAMVYVGTLNPAVQYTLSVSGVRDISNAGNPIAANTPVRVVGPSLTASTLLWEYWPNIPGNPADLLEGDADYPGMPSQWRYISAADTNPNGLTGYADSYGARMSGWLTPTADGDYRFFIRSDDGSKLYLSPNEDPAAAGLIAYELGCCNAFLEPASVDPAQNGSLQTSDPQALKAGTAYYFSFIYKEGGGGDWGQVAWRKEGDPTPAGSLTPLPASLFKAYRTVPPAFNTPTVAGGTLTISWVGVGTLQQSSNLVSWSNVPGNPTSPYQLTLPPGAGFLFYRIAQ